MGMTVLLPTVCFEVDRVAIINCKSGFRFVFFLESKKTYDNTMSINY